jgi:hypothetical protein
VEAAAELAAGRPVETAALVVCLRDFIRQVLDLARVYRVGGDKDDFALFPA